MIYLGSMIFVQATSHLRAKQMQQTRIERVTFSLTLSQLSYYRIAYTFHPMFSFRNEHETPRSVVANQGPATTPESFTIFKPEKYFSNLLTVKLALSILGGWCRSCLAASGATNFLGLGPEGLGGGYKSPTTRQTHTKNFQKTQMVITPN